MPKHIDKPKIDGLTQRQENFALEYVRTGDPVASFKASYTAGGKPATINSQCNKLLRNPAIKARIAELRDEIAERAEITVADVVRELWDNAMAAKQAKPIRDKDGNETGEYRADLAASNQALKLVGDHLGVFEKKPAGEQKSPLEALSPEQRQALRVMVDRERERRAALAAGARPPADDAGGTGRTLQ